MPASILVTYASPGGSTKEVAEAVAQTLREAGQSVDLASMEQVASLTDYLGFVLGAPIYNTLWHQTALTFLTRHQVALTGKPTVVFALGPVQKGEPVEFTRARQQLEICLKRFAWFKPIDTQIFGGKMKATDSGFPLNLIFKPTPAVDFRDWTAIRAWSAALPQKLSVHPQPDLKRS
ncbi:MAG: flavodoxin domain-containing protein [Chloroflexota bacterium]|nr:flavodoxin domain-containing protein [Chloroflexota bacterium]